MEGSVGSLAPPALVHEASEGKAQARQSKVHGQANLQWLLLSDLVSVLEGSQVSEEFAACSLERGPSLGWRRALGLGSSVRFHFFIFFSLVLSCLPILPFVSHLSLYLSPCWGVLGCRISGLPLPLSRFVLHLSFMRVTKRAFLFSCRNSMKNL